MTGAPHSILVVEDELGTRHLPTILADEYICSTASGLEEAAGLIAVAHFDLVLSDAVLPDGSGLDLARTVGEQAPETLVILLTEGTDIAYTIRAISQGAWYCIDKALDPDLLLVWLKTALRCQRLARQRHASSTAGMRRSSVNPLSQAVYPSRPRFRAHG
jgi:DNA-binding NtrC family response regulator